jgi:hypothetical protein
VTAPPSTAPKYSGDTGPVGELVFANEEDGYVLGEPGSNGASYFVTIDGGRSWHGAGFGPHMSVFAMVATPQAFYAVLVRCVGGPTRTSVQHCSDYRLAHSRAGSTTWSSVPVPGTTALDGAPVGLAAGGNDVWLTFQPQNGASPSLLRSLDGRPRFITLAEPSLVSVAACALSAMPNEVVWAECPTGMLVSWWRSADGGRHFTDIWTTSGTGGGDLDPVSGAVAYRYTGIGPRSPRALELTTDGGARFSPLATLPFDPGSRTQLLFISTTQGYAVGSGTSLSGGSAENETPALLYTGDGGRHWRTVPIG